jgi:hypothetical protein
MLATVPAAAGESPATGHMQLAAGQHCSMTTAVGPAGLQAGAPPRCMAPVRLRGADYFHRFARACGGGRAFGFPLERASAVPFEAAAFSPATACNEDTSHPNVLSPALLLTRRPASSFYECPAGKVFNVGLLSMSCTLQEMVDGKQAHLLCNPPVSDSMVHRGCCRLRHGKSLQAGLRLHVAWFCHQAARSRQHAKSVQPADVRVYVLDIVVQLMQH